MDARHFEQHLGELTEPAEQVGFADVVMLNKTDLVQDTDLARIEQRIRGINGTARIVRTHNADVPIDAVLGLGAFDLDRALAVDATFLEPQYPVRVGRCLPAACRAAYPEGGGRASITTRRPRPRPRRS